MKEKATFAAGCFWGVEEAFAHIPGVLATRVGYTGGSMPDPSYQQVCTDTTGHAEAVEVEYDPDVISYGALLNAFWQSHNPTTSNRQGPDIGSQYRSAIFVHTPEQEREAVMSKALMNASGTFSRPIITEITSAGPFYPAEEYHQKYLQRRDAKACH